MISFLETYNRLDELKKKFVDEREKIDGDSCKHDFGDQDGIISCSKCGLVKTCGKVEFLKYEPDSSSWEACNPWSGGPSISKLGGGGSSTIKVASWIPGVLSQRDIRLFNRIKRSCKDFFPAAYIYKTLEMFNQISKQGSSRTSNRDGILAAIIFYVCHQESIREISEPFIMGKFAIEKKRFDFGCKRLSLWIEKENEEGRKKSFSMESQEDLIKMFRRDLRIPLVYEKISKRIIKRLNRSQLVIQNTSRSLAIGSLYYLTRKTGLEIDKEAFREKCNISKATLDKVYKNLDEYRKILVSDEEKKELLSWIKLHGSGLDKVDGEENRVA